MKSIYFFVIFAAVFFGGCFSVDERENEVAEDNTRGTCTTDRDCDETDYCSKNSMCLPCYSCEKIHQVRAVKRCAKSANDCGRCQPGYFQSSYSGPNKKRVCQPVLTVAEPMTAEIRSHFTMNPATVIGLIILGTLVITAFISWRCYAKRSTPVVHDSWAEMGLGPRARCGDGASLPPPSYEDVQRSENGSVAYSFQLRIAERPEKQTTAIPFQLPYGEHIVSLAQPSQETSNAANSNPENVPESEATYQTPTAIDIHDESTQPSMWTPGTSYFMNQNIDETDCADGPAKDEKVSPPNKRRKPDKKDDKSNDS